MSISRKPSKIEQGSGHVYNIIAFDDVSPMFHNALFTKITRVVIGIALLSTTYLYLYPVWLGCTFPSTDGHSTTALTNTVYDHLYYDSASSFQSAYAPFRLLILADPQLEGDSSLPQPNETLSARLSSHWSSLKNASVIELPLSVPQILAETIIWDVPREINAWRKRLDLLGNDYYLAHIFRTLRWWTKPTHVTVLGDLIGSQWVDDAEFEYRGWRFWNRVFAGGRKVEDEFMQQYNQTDPPLLDMDDPRWQEMIINIAGNHDIGYAGDISQARMTRFEATFGKANWDVRFKYPGTSGQDGAPSLHLVVLNSMLLDTPAMDEDLQAQTYQYLNSIISKRARPVEDQSSFVLFLTHVPLHKEEGVCVDAPFFGFYENDQNCTGLCRPGGLREQNHLSAFASHSGTLGAMFGMSGDLGASAQGKGRPGLILDGHDHEGCDVWHYIPAGNTTFQDEENGETKNNWQTVRWKDAASTNAHTGIREVTLRSMMGEFGGNAGLLSMWYDFTKREWQYGIKTCKVGIQHIWWAIHVVDLLAVAALAYNFALLWSPLTSMSTAKASRARRKNTKVE